MSDFRAALTPFFRAWWRFSRGMTLGVRVLACDADGRVLLVKHSYIKGWHFPGGGVEHEETATDAAARELAEEGGVRATGALQLFGFYSNAPDFPNDHVAFYVAPSWEKTAAPPDPHEIADYGFFARDALPDGVTQGTKRRLAEIFDRAPVSPFWSPRVTAGASGRKSGK